MGGGGGDCGGKSIVVEYFSGGVLLWWGGVPLWWVDSVVECDCVCMFGEREREEDSVLRRLSTMTDTISRFRV